MRGGRAREGAALLGVALGEFAGAALDVGGVAVSASEAGHRGAVPAASDVDGGACDGEVAGDDALGPRLGAGGGLASGLADTLLQGHSLVESGAVAGPGRCSSTRRGVVVGAVPECTICFTSVK